MNTYSSDELDNEYPSFEFLNFKLAQTTTGNNDSNSNSNKTHEIEEHFNSSPTMEKQNTSSNLMLSNINEDSSKQFQSINVNSTNDCKRNVKVTSKFHGEQLKW